jgi:hypothetical protein
MKALVYRGAGFKALENRPKPEIQSPDDAIVKIVKTTICGTDLHILKGDVPTCEPAPIDNPSPRRRHLGRQRHPVRHQGAGVAARVACGAHLNVSRAAHITRAHESDLSRKGLEAIAEEDQTPRPLPSNIRNNVT